MSITGNAMEMQLSPIRDAFQRQDPALVITLVGRVAEWLLFGVVTLEHRVLPDRIETGTYAMAAAITGGDIFLEGARPELLHEALVALRSIGVDVSEEPGGIRVSRNGHGLEAVSVETQPFPGFPTDLQAQLMALMCTANGVSEVRETIFENRFMHVQELARLGARIDLRGDTALVHGVSGLRGAPVMATDLRASVSLIIAGLAAQGETTIG